MNYSHDDKEERIEFMPPKGVIPDDTKHGDTFDLVSTYRLKDNGEICLIQIGDAKMPGYDEDDYNEKSKAHRKDYTDMASAMSSAMQSRQGGGPGNTDTGDY